MPLLCPSPKTRPDSVAVDRLSPPRSAEAVDRGATSVGSWFRRRCLDRLAQLRDGQLTLVDALGAYEFGQVGTTHQTATLVVLDPRFYREVALRGNLGAAEAFIRGYWDSPDLTAALQIFAANLATVTQADRGATRFLQPLRRILSYGRRNTRAGSRRNIAAHYDLSNEFFALMLDATMTYSSGVFTSPQATLEEASYEKYDRICRKLQLTSRDHVLEIGTGWGGFAEHAARNYGCRVTTTTISQAQHDFAQRRFQNGDLLGRVNLLLQDYRDLQGKFDKLVSIEMIEAVGAKFLPTYFAKCSSLLRPEGSMAIQAITIPDHRFEGYRRSVDFIQRYIFPGGCLPSVGAISRAIGDQTDFRFHHSEDFAPHYALTLKHWRQRFWQSIAEVRQLGFDERFIRTWHYYLSYCEAGFRERQIGVAQMLLTKPKSQLEPILA